MNVYNFLTSPITNALGWTLLHAIWQGFALVLPTAVVLYFLRHRSGVMRYRVGVFTLLAQVLVSAGTFFWYYQPISATQLLAPATTARYASSIRWQTVAQSIPWHQQTQQFLENHLSQFVLVYLIGVALFGLRLAGGWMYLQQLSKTAMPPASQHWLNMANQIRATLSIRAVVQVRESARVAMPMVVGVLKPVLLLPIGLATYLSTREIEAVLAHELAHIKRHDYAVNLLQSVVEVLYFFHPALWWLSARVREEREHCCDDLAVQVCGGDGRILAQALARVEELLLAQSAQTPVLAMAFASKRQHLLHRVRRVLGVPTRPFVSNSSLAGLTLATILFMSVSVYAVQQQQPAPKQPKPAHATRRHKVDSKSEYGMEDNKRIGYVIWKGQKLPATKVATLQRQLDQVMAGTLSLDAVRQPNRDILLTIIEKNNGFDRGIEGLTKGLAHIDYDNIVASAMNEVKGVDYRALVADAMNQVKAINYDSIVNSTTLNVEKIDYNRIITEAMASVDTTIFDRVRVANGPGSNRYNQRNLDSLSQLMAQHARQMQALHLQMEKLRFPVEEVERQNEVLNWKKDKLMEQRNALIEKHQKLLYNNEKQKLSQAEVEKQVEALEPEIKKLEGSMEELNRQMEQSSAKQEELKVPMEKLEQESQKLEEQIEKLSSEMERYSEGLSRIMPAMPPMPAMNIRVTPRPARAPRPPRVPRSAIAPTPPAHPGGLTVPSPAPPIPKVAPVPSAKPAPAPKPE